MIGGIGGLKGLDPRRRDKERSASKPQLIGFSAAASPPEDVTSITIPMPDGLAKDDLLVAIILQAGGGDSFFLPPGYASVASGGGNYSYGHISVKKAGDSEDPVVLTGTGPYLRGCVFAVRNARSASLVAMPSYSSGAGYLTFAAPTLTSGILFGAQVHVSSLITIPVGMTLAANVPAETGNNAKFAYEEIPVGFNSARNFSSAGGYRSGGFILVE